jgi:predicted anti-sigma-YlaC factor YlaD
MGEAMDSDHGEWTDKLSDYLDGELRGDEHRAVEAHLASCAQCAAVLADLNRVVARAKAAKEHAARPPQADLWAGIAARIENPSISKVVPFGPRRRFTFTLPQLAAAAAVLIAISGGLAWQTAERHARRSSDLPSGAASPEREALAERGSAAVDDVQAVRASLADPQYDAAVADLEKALKDGRGRLDENTIAIVEHNLQIIDQAIEQARQALVADPANNYLSSHLFEARRRKLDLLRRAAALSSESD